MRIACQISSIIWDINTSSYLFIRVVLSQEFVNAIMRKNFRTNFSTRNVLYSLILLMVAGLGKGQKLNPEEKAPNFTLPTLKGPIIYKGLSSNETNIRPPIIFHEFTNHSGFLEALWTKETSILELIDNSPENTNYVFLTSANDAVSSAEWMKSKFEDALEKYYLLAKNLST